jgi:acetyl-CoA carboxylase biotin carboxyl carrier protein
MIDLDKLEKILELMSRYGVDVVQAESAKERFAVARNAPQAHFFGGGAGVAAPAVAASGAAATGAPFSGQPSGSSSQTAQAGGSSADMAQTAAAPKTPEVGKLQRSELVGTFYRSASPTSAPFVEVGKSVRKGQTLCIVEAMKIMNEIEAEWDGEILEVLVENGKPVEFGTPLFRIKPH